MIEETIINEYGQPQHAQGDIEEAGYVPDADPSQVEDWSADDGFVEDSDLPDPNDLDQA